MNYLLPLQQFSHRVEQNPEQAYLHQPVNSQWNTYSFKDVDVMARKIASGLLAQGYQKGERIAILAHNCAEWIVTDIAIMMAGMISVPIYPSANAKTIKHVLSHSGAKAVFVGKVDDASAAASACQTLNKIALPYPTIDPDFHWNNWLDNYAPLTQINHPDENDVLTIIYTSGSTGVPKGVVLTHDNIAAGIRGLDDWFVDSHNRILSYLPMAHIAERSFAIMGSIYNSTEVFFNESRETFVQDLHYAQVTLFASVPRLWTNFQSQVFSQIKDGDLQQLLKTDQSLKVAAQIRQKLGFKHCKRFISGTAPISPGLLNWYHQIGIDIYEAWGMTETSGAACKNSQFLEERLGCIGVPVKGVEMKLSDQGEILIRGDSVFDEYYQNPEANKEEFEQGWFKTGDCGSFDEHGIWKIIGRLKEQFKSAKGKYVAPVPIESLVLDNPYIEQTCVMGSGMRQPVALVVLNVENSRENDEIVDSLNLFLAKLNSELESHEKLAALFVVESPWTVANELLTATMKLKRMSIESKYREDLIAVNPSGVVWEEEVVY